MKLRVFILTLALAGIGLLTASRHAAEEKAGKAAQETTLPTRVPPEVLSASPTLRFFATPRGKDLLERSPNPNAKQLLKFLFGEDAARAVPSGKAVPSPSGPRGIDLAAATATMGCDPTNGTRFNLEPRVNALAQIAGNVDFLPNRVAPGVDLVVGTANDNRGMLGTGTLPSSAGYYVHRAASNCAAQFEGGLAAGGFSIGQPVVVADPARDAFYIADEEEPGIALWRTQAATLLNPVTCPDGTHAFFESENCWHLARVAIGADSVNTPFNQHVAVDERPNNTKGQPLGAGDTYVTAVVSNSSTVTDSIQIAACHATDTLICGAPEKISGSDTRTLYANVQVRGDGVITIVYLQLDSLGFGQPRDIKFVSCTPAGAPNPPKCQAPVLVQHETQPVDAIVDASLGGAGATPGTNPTHAHRPETTGGFTTFLTYNRCKVPQQGQFKDVCPDADVVMTTSTDGGKTWSPLAGVNTNSGHQFSPGVKLDSSTNVVNVAYYNTQADFFNQRAQIYLNQISPGTTTVKPPVVLTLGGADLVVAAPASPIGLDTRGTGTPGQSRAYVTFTSAIVKGLLEGVPFDDANNHLTRFDY